MIAVLGEREAYLALLKLCNLPDDALGVFKHITSHSDIVSCKFTGWVFVGEPSSHRRGAWALLDSVKVRLDPPPICLLCDNLTHRCTCA